MHANTALPIAWALGTMLVLTGCASRGHSTTHPLDLPVPAAVVASTQPPALRVPSPASLQVMRPGQVGTHGPRAVPLGREDGVHPGLAAPVQRPQVRPAPCALTPELSARRTTTRAASADYDIPALIERSRMRRRAQPQPDRGTCAGGT